MNKILLLTIVFISGYLILVFMPLIEDKSLYDNYIYISSVKGFNERRKIITIIDDITINYPDYDMTNDLVCNFSSEIDPNIKAYNELMIQYAVRYADAANKLYNPPVKITGKAILGMAKQEKTPDPINAVIWQGYWKSLLSMKNEWMDIRYTDLNVNDAITGKCDGPLQITIYYGRNNPAIPEDLGHVGTTESDIRVERVNNSLIGDRFNALDSMNMTAGELARVMSSIPDGECTNILRTCNEYAIGILAAYAHNFGEGVFTSSDNNTSIAPYADFSKVSLYKFAKFISEDKEIRKIIETEIKNKGSQFSMSWKGETAEKIFRYCKQYPIGDEKIDSWIAKTYDAIHTGTQWYAGGISCAHRLFYGINAYANTVWLELYTTGQIS